MKKGIENRPERYYLGIIRLSPGSCGDTGTVALGKQREGVAMKHDFLGPIIIALVALGYLSFLSVVIAG